MSGVYMSSSTIKDTNAEQNVTAGRRSFLPPIAAYYCVSSILLFWKLDSFVKDALVAPLYFVIPAGIGLFILSINGAHRRLQEWLSRPQLILSGAFIGFVAISLLHQELERSHLLQAVFPWLFPALTALSLFGCYRSREWLVVDATTGKRAAKTLLLLLPFAAFAYYFQYLYFSSFPLRDIFQETHFMKGAHELSRTQVLNPFITASYLPLIQILLGQLHHFYGLDLLRANWILPAYAYLFHLACYAVFFSSFLRDRNAFRLALVLTTVLAPMFYIENMIMLESMLLVLFSILVRSTGAVGTPGRFGTVLVGLVVLFAVYHFYFNYVLTPLAPVSGRPPAPYAGMWMLAAALFAVAVFQDNTRIAASAFLALFAVSAFGMHRGILLFMPMILFAGAAYRLVTGAKMISQGPDRHIMLVTWALTGGTLVFLAAFAMWLLGRYGSHDTVSNGWLTTGIAEYLLRTTKIEAAGTGFGHSLVEYLRLFPPLLILATLALLVGFLISYGKKPFPTARQDESAMRWAHTYPHRDKMVYFVLVVAVLTALTLSTVPYAYRGAFFPAVFGIALFAGLMSGYVAYADKDGPSRGRIVWVSLALLVYMLLGTVYLYSPSRSFLDDTNTYLSAARPLLMVMAVGGFLLFGLLLTAYRRRKVVVHVLSVLVVLAAAFDAVGFRTLFSEKAYGKNLPESGVISHYTSLDIDLGLALRTYPPKTILISDPYTLSILRGVSGLNSAYSFANINLVSDADKYRNLFQFIAALDRKPFNMVNAGELFGHVYSLSGSIGGEAMYFWSRVHAGTDDLVTVDDIYRHFIFVINNKTFRWAAGEDSYYPDNSPIPDNLVSRLQGYFDIEKNLDGRLLVMRLKRQPGPVTGPDEDRHRLPSQPCICPPLLRDSTAPILPRHGTGKAGSK